MSDTASEPCKGEAHVPPEDRDGEIRALYTDLARNPNNDFGWSKGKGNARTLGYERSWLDRFPDPVWESSAGVGNPFALGAIHGGETVVEFGCGAGADTCVAALLVGEAGRVIAIDLTPAMVEKTRANVSLAGFNNVTVFEGDMAEPMLPEAIADVVISNGSINLSPRKACVLKQAFRVLKPGGRVYVADMVRDPSSQPSPDRGCVTKGPTATWANCVAGTVSPNEFLDALTKAGFQEAEFVGMTGYRTSPQTVGALFRAQKPVLSRNPAKKPLQELSPQEIQAAVADRYGEVATAPGQKFNFPVGRAFAESVGYDAAQLDRLPRGIWESFTGAGNPQPFVDAQPGETVLDLGCGAGLDLYLYAKKVGSSGKLYGLDLSPAMLDKARSNLSTSGVTNVDWLLAPADAIPLPDRSVDLVTANGIYNLSPDKDAVMREVARVLKPGGRTIFAEIVLKSALPVEVRREIDDWFRCIGGALVQHDFLERLERNGLIHPQVLWIGRNARTGHPLSLSAVIRAERNHSTPQPQKE